MTLREFIRSAEEALSSLYSKEEARSIAQLLVEGKFSMTYTQMALGMDEKIDTAHLLPALQRLVNAEPIQYVLGCAQFMGFDFRVGHGVLIPRPETEDLVIEIEKYLVKSGRVLDACTGSGAIAIALKLRNRDQQVTAFDLSKDALEYAKDNAARLGAAIFVQQRDALQDFSSMGTFDIIVSNPPYVPASDYLEMHTAVKDHEPKMAIFVSDSDTLVFYRSIARNARKMLSKDGVLLFEIYEKSGEEVSRMLYEMQFSRVEVKKDRFDKDRIVVAWM
ncbi:MAG: peptide chain release factor N(5)-glutamine methyltransferase [Alistipes sp.]|nr:peptide chain release factor N(5)-glutamine methyltransferase [Candidatus Alistipes equi]